MKGAELRPAEGDELIMPMPNPVEVGGGDTVQFRFVGPDGGPIRVYDPDGRIIAHRLRVIGVCVEIVRK